MDKVKVAVRVRPFNRRELDQGSKCVICMHREQTVLLHPTEAFSSAESNHDQTTFSHYKKPPKTFAFDHCFWSMDSKNLKFDNQETVFKHLGNDILERAFEGYNACIFAYGQTGSGKSYSMMGINDQKGIIPRLCDTLFNCIKDREVEGELTFKVEVSYMEIYNEKVKDLLNPSGKHNLKVREHKILGPYVDDLSILAVTEYQDIATLMSEGNKSRTVAATNMNNESSRSHAVFSIIVTQTLIDIASAVSGEKVSKISLVDLAGSERALKTGATGDRLKEGSNINKSLTTLGLVISALAEQNGKKQKFVPYRDSTLTWLLKDNLGGNSKTVMVATLSPAADNYEETLSTLRYADRAKRIVNHAVVNEDPNARIIRELRTEVDELRKMLCDAGITIPGGDIKIAEEKIQESEKLISEIGVTWEEKLRKTEKIQEERQAALEKMGISVETSGIKVEHSKFYLVNLNADPSLNELLVYYLKEKTLVGHSLANHEQDIQLNGLGIEAEHCVIEIETSEVFLVPVEGARTCVNGRAITERTRVRHGNRILWGNNHFFRINCPRTSNAMNSSVTSSTSSDDLSHDFDFAQSELMGEDDCIQEAIMCVEKQHAEDKEEALQRQREMYENQMSRLRTQMTRSPSASAAMSLSAAATSSSTSCSSLGALAYPGAATGLNASFDATPPNARTSTSSGANVHPKYQQWLQDREKLYKRSLSELKHELTKAGVLVREANTLAQEMSRNTQFSVTLQIPAANLSPNRKRGAFVSEPAVLMTRGAPGGQRIYDMDQFENKIIDLREIYAEWKERSTTNNLAESPTATTPPSGLADPFSGEHETQSLVGVGNVFLSSLFHDVKLDYQVPIISQQGEVSGRLHVELWRIAGTLNNPAANSSSSMTSSTHSSLMTNSAYSTGGHAYSSGGHAYSTTAPTSMTSSTTSTTGDLQAADNSAETLGADSTREESLPDSIVCQIRVKSVCGLPPCLSNFVFCQYSVWGHNDAIVVPPSEERTAIMGNLGAADLQRKVQRHGEDVPIKFDHCKQFTIGVSEEFIEHCSEGGAISIEVWGHQGQMGKHSDDHSDQVGWQVAMSKAKSRSIVDRWAELTRKIELSVEIQELSEQGDYLPVEISQKPEILTGGVYQLRQGQSRRIQVSVRPQGECGRRSQSGTLPLICDQITCVQIGSVNARSSIQRGLDSYQELDLTSVRERWSDALAKRKQYLDQQLQMIMNKSEKSPADVEREKSLIDQWVRLTDELNDVLVPAAGTVIPGAPADWDPPSHMEQHIPVIFLDLNSDDMSTPNTDLSGECSADFYSDSPCSPAGNSSGHVTTTNTSSTAASSSSSNNAANALITSSSSLSDHCGHSLAGANSILPKEHGTLLFALPFLRNSEMISLLSWDSSIHESIHLNRVTPANERVYLIVKVIVRLSHPVVMEIILRKRIAVNIYKRQSITDKLKRKIGIADSSTCTAVTYEIVSNIPKASEDLEDRTSLAQMAAAGCQSIDRSRGENGSTSDTSGGDTYIEKYIKGVSAVESILVLDRLRQEVFIKELISSNGRVNMRKSTSFPNMQNICSNSSTSISDDSMMRVSNEYEAIQHNNIFEAYKKTPVETTDKIIQATSSVPVPPKKLLPLFEEHRTSTTSEDTITNECYSDDCEHLKKETSTSSASLSTDSSTTTIVASISSSNANCNPFPMEDETTQSTASPEVQPQHPAAVHASTTTLAATEDGSVSTSCNSASEHTSTSEPTSAPTATSLADPSHRKPDSLVDTSLPNTSTDPNSDPSPCTTLNESSSTEDSKNTSLTSAILSACSMASSGYDSQVVSVVSSDEECLNGDTLPAKQNGHDNAASSVVDTASPRHPPRSSTPPSPPPTLQQPLSPMTLTDNNRLNSCNINKMLRGSTSPGVVTACSPSGPMKATYRPDEAMYSSVTSLPDDDCSSQCSFGSRADLHRAGADTTPVPSWIQPGEPVLVMFSGSPSKPGVVKFVGATQFASGQWVGVAMLKPDGKNDGCVKDVRYFKCPRRHGVFVRADKILVDRKRRRSSGQGGGSNPSLNSSSHSSSSTTTTGAVLRRSTCDLSGHNTSSTSSNTNTTNTSTSTPPPPSSGGFMKATAASSAKHKA